MRDLMVRLRQTTRRLLVDWRYAGPVVLILAIGIGPASAMVSVVERVLLRPLGYEEPDRIGLVRIDLGEVQSHAGLSHNEIKDLRALDNFFASVEAMSREFEMSLGQDPDFVPVSAVSVTPNLFRELGVSPLLGRHFTDEDLDAAPVVISHDLWRTQFGGDRGIVGTTVLLNGTAREVIGVMPPGFALHLGRGSQLSSRVDLWNPFRLRDSRNFWAVPTLVRLRAGVTYESVNEGLVAFAEGLTDRYPEHYAGTNLRFVVHPLLGDLVRETRPAIRAALVGVGLLLIIAFANATALVVARLKARETDFAIRSALGAGRRALVGEVIVESAVLSVAGAVAGAGLAAGCVSAVQAFVPRTVPRWDTIAVGWELVAYATGLAVVGLLVAGLVPALRVSGRAPWDVLRGMSKQGGSARAPGRMLLVGTQVALAVVLGFGGVQLARSAVRLSAADLGYDANVLTFRAPFDGRTFDSQSKQAELYQRIRDRLLDVPGVTAVGAISHLPLSGTGPIDAYTANLADSAGMDQSMANYFAITPGYLESLRIPLRQGRLFTDEEDARGDALVVIDETLARSAFGSADPINRELRLGWGLPNARVVGVVGHARAIDVSREVRPQIYAPYGLFPWSPLYFTVRASGDPASLTAAVRTTAAELGPGRALSRFQLLGDNVEAATSTLRSVTVLVMVLAGSAAVLSALGLYAVITFVVHQHRRATAIRSALGATPAQLVWLHLRNGGLVLAVAVPAGLILSAVAAPFFGSLVYGVAERDFLSLVAAAALATMTGLLGTYLPVRSAARADPTTTLRAD